MDTKVEEPPLKMTNRSAPSPSLSSLPDEIVVNCLARISKSQYNSFCLVSKNFYSVLSSPEIYTARFQIGTTEPRLYVSIWSPTSTYCNNWFTLTIPDQTLISNGGEIKKLRLEPVKLSSSSLEPVRLSSSSDTSSPILNATTVSAGSEIGGNTTEDRSRAVRVFDCRSHTWRCVRLSSSSDTSSPILNATTVSAGSEIYEIGGNTTEDRSRAVRVFDCRSHTWRCGPNMNVARTYPETCFLDGKIYVFGGCKKREDLMYWGEVFDLKNQTWKPLASPSSDDDKWGLIYHKVVVLESRIYVIVDSKYYAYDAEGGRWKETPYFRRFEYSLDRPGICVVENVKFEHCIGDLWYESIFESWKRVKGLGNLFMNCKGIVQLVNYCGKLVVIWRESIEMDHGTRSQNEKIVCAVIRLEKKFLSPYRWKIWGHTEQSNVIVDTVPGLCRLLSCLSVSL